MPNPARIVAIASQSAPLADLISIGWSFTQWMPGCVEPFLLPNGSLITTLLSYGRPRPDDLMLVERPSTAHACAQLMSALAHIGWRAFLLPNRRENNPWLVTTLRGDPSTPTDLRHEALFLTAALEQHYRLPMRTPTHGNLRDAHTQALLVAALSPGDWDYPVTLTPNLICPSEVKLSIHMVPISAYRENQRITNFGENSGFLVIPDRAAYHVGESLDAGEVVILRDRSEAMKTIANAPYLSVPIPDDHRFMFYIDDESRILVGDHSHQRASEVSIFVQTPSLLSPYFHQAWADISQRISMPWLRDEIVAASSDDAVRRRLLFE